jgi:hypothetical protein
MAQNSDAIATWASEFDARRRDFDAGRAKGLIMDEEMQKEVVDDLARLRREFRKVREGGVGLAPSDLARREVLLTNLEEAVSRAAVFNSQRGGLRGKQAGYGQETDAVNEASNSEAINPMQISGSGLRQQNERTIALQDGIIDEIEQGVGRLYNQAVNISAEAKTQSKLLDNIEDNTDTAAGMLRNEAEHAHEVRQKSEACTLYICIAVEVIVVVILVVILSQKKN